MARPIFISKFEQDEAVIRDRMIDSIADTWRKEPGDFIYDAVAASPVEIKQLQINQDNILMNGFAMYAEGEFLDLRLDEVGLKRAAATKSKRSILVTADAGVVIPVDTIASTVVLDDGGNPIEFLVDTQVTFAVAGQIAVNLTSVLAGVITDVPLGSEFIFQPSIAGVRVISDGAKIVSGHDEETDNEAWIRYQDRVSNPDTGGNRNDYVRWAKEVEGVGAAKCVPRWAGNSTVKVVIVNAMMAPASVGLVADVQNYIDPGITGLGDGVAPCGAAVTVVAASSILIDVTATVIWDDTVEVGTRAQAFEDALAAYLASTVFASASVNYNRVAAILTTTKGVTNYSGLLVNGGTADVVIGTYEVAGVGTVTI